MPHVNDYMRQRAADAAAEWDGERDRELAQLLYEATGSQFWLRPVAE